MEQTPATRLHPLLAIAAVSVTALSLAGIAYLTDIIPGRTPEPASMPAPPAAAPATAAPAPAVTVNVAPVPRKPAANPTPRVVERRTTETVEVVRGEPARELRLPPAAAPVPAVCRNCGIIESVREIAQPGAAEGPGIGAVAGGVIGGVLGNQVGKGSGRDVATVVGIVGGAVAGHEIEKRQKKIMRWDIVVRMDDGSSRTVSSQVEPAWRAGERVRVENGALIADTGYRY